MAADDWSLFGLAIGHATDHEGGTGCTIIRGIDGAFRASAATLGRATGTRELDALSPGHLVPRVDAILLTGGSAYGLGAADGAMRWMERRGRGFPVGAGVVPIVPAAVIFDLGPTGRFDARPTPDMAWIACENASPANVEEGSVGVGTGATVGKGLGLEHAMKGGVGWNIAREGDVAVGAIAVVNALGDVRGGDGAIIAGARDANGVFMDVGSRLARSTNSAGFPQGAMQQTTLALVATNVLLDRLELQQLAAASGAALHRRITPAGTTFDGDVIFSACPLEGERGIPLQVEVLAVRALERAIERAVRLARGRDGVYGLADGDPE